MCAINYNLPGNIYCARTASGIIDLSCKYKYSSCLTQAQVNTAFSAWLATASASGGCNGILTNNNTGAPLACGGATTVTFTYTVHVLH
jgi:hypothetical protein